MTLDELIELRVELEDMTRRLNAIKHRVTEEIIAQGQRPDIPTHEFAPASRTASFCHPCENDEPPSKPV